MGRYLIIYGTVEGHTKKVAERTLEAVRERGAQAELIDASKAMCLLLEEGEYDGVIVCAPVHGGEHPEPVVTALKENLAGVQRVPGALVSVSLSAALRDPEHQAEAVGYVDRLTRETGWTPDRTLLLAGALKYSEYDFMKRFVMKLLAQRHGVSSDTSQDSEYTDWDALEAFVGDFVGGVEKREIAPAAAAR